MKVEEKIKEIYKVRCHKHTPYFNKTLFDQTIGKSTYGEMGPTGVDNIVKYFKKYFNNDTIFYDLGCGLGKMILHLGLKYDLKKVCGIEYSKERYQGCKDTQLKYCNHLSNIFFINDSYYNVKLEDATIIYWDNTAHLPNSRLSVLPNIPQGCLVIHKREIPHQKSEEIKNENFVTTYGSKHIYFFIKN